MKRYGSKEFILGVNASSRSVHAVLVRDTPDGPVIVQQFHRSRTGDQSFTPLVPDFQETGGGDVTFNVGEKAQTDSTIFLAAEFGAGSESTDSKMSMVAGPSVTAPPFDLELMDIVDECQDAGYDDFRIVFAVDTSLLSSVEVEIRHSRRAERERGKGKTKSAKVGTRKKTPPKAEAFQSALAETHGGQFDPEKVTFIPMKHNEDTAGKCLAVFTVPSEPVASTLQVLRDRKRSIPPVDLMDTEITLFLGLTRAAWFLRNQEMEIDPEESDLPNPTSPEDAQVLFVRAGIEDTTVMFMQGERLVRFESLRSITAFDPPETICSRVLLLQDEFGIADADMVVLLGDDREDALLESFQTFFRDTHVVSLRKYLPVQDDPDAQPLSREAVLASAVTMRLLGDNLYKTVFQDVNFLPRKLTRRHIDLPFTWPIAAMYVLLFVSSLYFVYKFYDQQHDIELYQYELKHYPENVIQATSQVLQARIDSLTIRTVGYLHSLDVLDSLLVGSDRWSRALSETAIHTSEVRGIWIESWNEVEGVLRLEGTATDRDDVVEFAARANGVIEELSFSSIRKWPVYSFTMRMTLPNVLPEAVNYFRDNVTIEPGTEAQIGS